MNNKCYRYEKILYKDGLFNKTIDATYIINLEGNGRLEYIMKQLEEYHPTNIVYIVFNKGFKKCKKADFIINPPYDLVDANLNIFKHAKNNNYDNILILEDDFIFDDKILDPFHRNNVNKFINTHNDFIFSNSAKKQIFTYQEELQDYLKMADDDDMMAKGGMTDVRMKYAKKDVNLLMKEGGMSMYDTKYGVLHLSYKDGVFTIKNNKYNPSKEDYETIFKGDKEGATKFVANS
jgi:hypothetical protein